MFKPNPDNQDTVNENGCMLVTDTAEGNNFTRLFGRSLNNSSSVWRHFLQL